MAIDRTYLDYAEPATETESDYDGYQCSRATCENIAHYVHNGKDLCDDHYWNEINSAVDYAVGK